MKLVQCSENIITTIDTGSGSNSITIGMDGLPVISYVGTTMGPLKVAKCGDNACSSRNITTVGPSGSHSPSITIGTDGLPIISYFLRMDLRWW